MIYEYLKLAVEDSGLGNIRPYSGRGMYGVFCIGITCSLSDFIKLIATAMVAAVGNDNEDHFIYRVGYVVSDTMGKSLVFYFPREKWLESYVEVEPNRS